MYILILGSTFLAIGCVICFDIVKMFGSLLLFSTIVKHDQIEWKAQRVPQSNEPRFESVFGVSDQVPHKQGCAITEND